MEAATAKHRARLDEQHRLIRPVENVGQAGRRTASVGSEAGSPHHSSPRGHMFPVSSRCASWQAFRWRASGILWAVILSNEVGVGLMSVQIQVQRLIDLGVADLAGMSAELLVKAGNDLPDGAGTTLVVHRASCRPVRSRR